MLPTVLFVDDDRIVRRVIARHCQSYAPQFSLLLAADGRQALEILRSTPVALVVTDIQMPVMDGLELTARLSEAYPDIPVIIQTAYGSAENRRKGQGARNCLATADEIGSHPVMLEPPEGSSPAEPGLDLVKCK